MKKKSNKNNRGMRTLLIMLIGVALAFGALLIFHQLKRVPKAQGAQTAAAVQSATTALAGQSDTTALAPPQSNAADAESYYRENAQKLIAVTPAEQSKELYNEKEVGKALSSKGFGEKFPITYEYNMDGSMGEKTQIDTACAALHPQYTVMYMTERGDYWTISVCNGCITAYPVTYNLEHNKGTELILAESESITGYDSRSNCFYETVPKPTALAVKQIPAITAEALEKLTPQEMEAL